MLKPRKRITRQQIKEDKLVTFTAKASSYYAENSRTILAVGGVVVVLAIAAGFFINSRAQAEKTATFDLTLAKIEIGQQRFDTAAEKLTQIIENYSGTRSAADALFFLGNVYLSQGNWDQARVTFQRYLDDYGKDRQLAPAAIAGLGLADEQEKKYRDAAERYLEAANRYPDMYNAPQYLMDAGRCFALAGDTARAEDTFKLVIDRYPKSELKQQAEDEMNRW